MNTDQLPTGWRIRKLGDLCEKPQYGFTASAVDGASRPRFLRITDQLESGIDWATVPGCECSDDDFEKYSLKSGDLVVARIGATTGNVSLVIDPPVAVFASYLIRLRAKPDVSPEYLHQFFKTDFYRRQIAANNDANLKGGINGSRLVELDVIEPPPPEQRRIAAMLEKLQKAVELEAAQERAARELKQAVMRRLFTRGLRREPTRETPLGSLPESWEETKIAGLGEIVTGTTPKTAKREYYDGGQIPFLAPGDLGESFFIEHSEKKITEAGAAVSRVLPKHAVCFVCIGSSIGKVGATTADRSTTNQQINAVIANEDFDPLFVGYLLACHAMHIASHASPSPVPIMSKGKFGEVSLWVTRDTGEQREIAAILSTLDRKIALHAARRRARQDLFRSTLHALLTARLRVPDGVAVSIIPAT